MPERRRQLSGPEAIAAALAGDEPIRLVLIRDGDLGASARAVLDDCRRAGVTVRPCSLREMRRMSASGDAEILALAGSDPGAPLDALMSDGGALWLLAGVGYPGNAGFAIRTAEVSGAAGILVDAPFDRARRRQTLRTAMRADRFLPVHWVAAGDVVDRARAAGRRAIAIEDTGTAAPWEVDLTGPTLLVIGGEAGGIAPDLLDACDETIRIPMRGFVPSYNLQAAMAMVAGERLRQLQQAGNPADD